MFRNYTLGDFFEDSRVKKRIYMLCSLPKTTYQDENSSVIPSTSLDRGTRIEASTMLPFSSNTLSFKENIRYHQWQMPFGKEVDRIFFFFFLDK